MPLFTVILTRIFFKEKQATSVYLSLVPIITGVGIATMTEISFDMLGLVCALFATLGFSIQNILSKKVLKDTGIHHLRLLHLLGRLALFLFLPVWFYFDFTKIIQEPTIVSAYYSLGKINVINILNGLQRKRLSFNRHSCLVMTLVMTHSIFILLISNFINYFPTLRQTETIKWSHYYLLMVYWIGFKILLHSAYCHLSPH